MLGNIRAMVLQCVAGHHALHTSTLAVRTHISLQDDPQRYPWIRQARAHTTGKRRPVWSRMHIRTHSQNQGRPSV